MNEILDFASNNGFAIVMCILMFYETIKTREAHKEEMYHLKDSIDNNTIVMQRLLDKMEV